MGYSVEFSTGTKKKNFHIAGKDDVIAKYNEGYQKGLDEGYENGVEDGRTAEWSDFWDIYQDYGNRTDYQYGFFGVGWNDETFNPKYDIVIERYPTALFSNTNITNLTQRLKDCGVNLNLSNITYYNSTFAGSEKLTHIPKLNSPTVASHIATFSGCESLITIEGIVVNSNTRYSGVFQYCYDLENMVIEGLVGQNDFNVSWSTKLTHDSLMSIINALQDKSTDTSGTTWTVTIGAANIEKLTDEELQIAYDKGWVVA